MSTDSKQIKWGNAFILVGFPVLAVALTVWYATTFGITWREPLAAVVIWWMTGLGVTAGYHRLFSHKGYDAPRWIRWTYAMLGGAACQNSVIAWASDHRYHHTFTDTDRDPYDATRGFFWSHMGWVFFEGVHGDAYDNVPDLRRDPVLAWQHEHYVLGAFATNVVLLGLATLLLGHGLGMLIVAGMLRIVVVQHFTFLINSAAHKWGSRPWSTDCSARDNWVLAFFTLGEGYHNYHHAFQHDYRNGVRWWQFDPTKWLIYGLSRVGLATKLRRMPVDVMLAARYERRRDGFAARLEAWGEGKAEAWRTAVQTKKEELTRRRDEFVASLRGTALHDQLVAAEASLDEKLAELKARRQALADRMRIAKGEMTADLKRELKHMKRALREAQRQAKAALKGYERLVREYVALEAVPAT